MWPGRPLVSQPRHSELCKNIFGCLGRLFPCTFRKLRFSRGEEFPAVEEFCERVSVGKSSESSQFCGTVLTLFTTCMEGEEILLRSREGADGLFWSHCGDSVIDLQIQPPHPCTADVPGALGGNKTQFIG